MLYRTVPKQDVTKQVTLPSIYGIYAITILLDYTQNFFTSHTIEQTGLFWPPPARQFTALQLFFLSAFGSVQSLATYQLLDTNAAVYNFLPKN